MSETLGSLVDKLSIVNCKLYAIQQWVHDSGIEPLEHFESQSHEEIRSNLQKLKDLNLQRNRLMTELDQLFADAIQTGIVVVDPRVKVV